MSSAPLRQIFASTSFRLALICAGVILLAFAAAGVAAWFVTKYAAEQASREHLLSEMKSLESELRAEGLNDMIAAVQARQQAPDSLEYRLVDPSGRLLAGDLHVTAQPGWSVAYFPDEPGRRSPDLMLLSETIPGIGTLTIAEDLERTEWVRYAVLRTLITIGLVALGIALVAGYAAARRALRDVDALVGTMNKVGAGDLAVRMPLNSAAPSDIAVIGRGINAMLERIDTLVANLRRVSNDIAHDLRTPLTHARQQLDEVITAPTLESARTAAAAAQTRIDDLMRTFAAILRLGEIDAGAAKARFAPVDLAQLAERVADAYRPDIEAAGRTLSIEAERNISITGDAALLSQALANLFENAMAHTPPGTAISLQVKADDGKVALTVADNGKGLATADRERVLRPFERLDASRTTPGAGLGLSIVNAIARLHSAKLELSDASPGLRVSMTWPSGARLPLRTETPAHADA